jgi:hypothetical protein
MGTNRINGKPARSRQPVEQIARTVTDFNDVTVAPGTESHAFIGSIRSHWFDSCATGWTAIRHAATRHGRCIPLD